MTDFKDLAQMRRSHRKFTEQEIDAEDVRLILRAALMSPTSKGQRAWQFVVVDNKTDIEKIADAKDLGSQFLKGAPLAIVVLGDPVQNDCWVEDGSIAAISMQYQAEDLGLGSCWIQVRNRMHDDETTASEWIKDLLEMDGAEQVVCVISIGEKAEERKEQNMEKLQWEKVSIV